MTVPDQPWSPSDATNYIREIARHPTFSLAYKLHAKERMAERNLITSDILYVLKNGSVYQDASCARAAGHFKYEIECSTPNSGGRSIRLVAIPDYALKKIKLITDMWVDETDTRSGTILEDNQ
ncbi:MAG TPA: hypothetical protein DIT67_09440 [Octadecabacter sp.]|nr:hypothetical protein [Octadecabacter sp.]